ncbi:MAG TPA: DUF2442 domain-containing protein [Terriglobia bacterium]|nr:DUF2442 domain-containing protein [Terriglobia bacterium]
MSSLSLQAERPRAQDVVVTDDSLVVELTDGRTVSTPLAWYPRLVHGTPAEREHWRLIGNGEGIHWPKLDEDLSVDGIIAGRPSGESAQSLRRWLDLRGKRGRLVARKRRVAHSGDKRARRK